MLRRGEQPPFERLRFPLPRMPWTPRSVIGHDLSMEELIAGTFAKLNQDR